MSAAGKSSPPALAVAAIVVVVALAVVFPVFVHQQIVVAGTLVLFSCYLAQCWNLAAGYGGLFSLGHTVFLAVGAYTSTVLFRDYGVSP